MYCKLFDVPQKGIQRPNFFGMVDFNQLTNSGRISAHRILKESNITLYSLDLENQQAIFVETPPEINLSRAPFYNTAQFLNAVRIFTISFEWMIRLSEEIDLDDDRVVLIYSVGRCGSTLASQIFAQVPGVINMSEPVSLTNLVVVRNAQRYNENYLLELLRSTMKILCKNKAESVWVIKGRSFDIEIGDWIHQLFPNTKKLFLYRNAETWLQSSLRAFERNDEETEVDIAERDKEKREFMNSLVPEIAEFNPEIHLRHVDMLCMMWLATMTRYIKWNKSGIDMLAVPYYYWKSLPLNTAEAILDYCGCKPSTMSDIIEVLGKDSQAGTRLSWDALRENKREITNQDLAILDKHLRNHPIIQKADFEVPNTLKFDASPGTKLG